MKDDIKNVKDSFGAYPHGCRLTHQNHQRVWPFCDLRPLSSDKRPSLFELNEGWEILGWCKAPYKSERDYNDAIVLEFSGDEDEEEHGIYWIHCRLERMNFIKI